MPAALLTLSPRSDAFWRRLQGLGVGVLVLLIVGLFAVPDVALRVLWNGLVPLLPATFLLAPALWRSVCPLATLNMATNRWGRNRAISRTWASRASVVGLMLLFVLVPARRLMLNESGLILALVLIGIGGLALGLGLIFSQKSGFCNAICPVLPVEKLYGQAPLLEMDNPRCDGCDRCIPKGCIDLVPSKALRHHVGTTAHTTAWLRMPYGAFSAAFPGFILAYFLLDDVPLAQAGSVYLTMGVGALASYTSVVGLVLLLRISAQRMLPVLAAVAVGLYYGFAAPQSVAAFGGPPILGEVLRGLLLVLVGYWLWHAWRSARPRPSAPPPPIAFDLPILDRTS